MQKARETDLYLLAAAAAVGNARLNDESSLVPPAPAIVLDKVEAVPLQFESEYRFVNCCCAGCC